MTNQTHQDRRFQIFLAHSAEDKQTVRNLCHRLKADGFAPWLDEEQVMPGQDWKREISEAVRQSDVFLFCISKSSVSREGYVNKELKYALDAKQERPPGTTIFIIPVRLDDVQVPVPLSQWEPVNLFEEEGYDRLAHALNVRAIALGGKISTSAAEPELPSHESTSLAADFTITFAAELSAEQIKATLHALADYYRACGGLGFGIDYEYEEALLPELMNA